MAVIQLHMMYIGRLHFLYLIGMSIFFIFLLLSEVIDRQEDVFKPLDSFFIVFFNLIQALFLNSFHFFDESAKLIFDLLSHRVSF